jgi:Rieske Fe-S protein
VIVGRVEEGRAPPGMYISAEPPEHSVRVYRDAEGQNWLIIGGESFKGGHVDDERAHFEDLERWAFDNFGAAPEYRWTNIDYTPMDQAPFIGWSSSIKDGYLVATGFDAWGLANGTAAGIIISDLIVRGDNPWLRVFDATRVKPVAGGKEFVKENLDVAAHLVSGWLSSKPKDFAALAPGDAAILKVDGENVAGFKDEEGRLHCVSAVCTHMGCLVGWNETDRTWDCPCHGSRFMLSGEVLHGPAVQPLEPKTFEEG